MDASWIDVEYGTPACMDDVLIRIKSPYGKHYCAIGQLVGKMMLPIAEEFWDCVDPDDEDDEGTLYSPPGWYVYAHTEHYDDLWMPVEGVVTHWMYLPDVKE